MAQCTQVPKFGSQEKDVPYNANSDSAKKGNPKTDASNPQDDPDFQEETKARVQKGPKHEHQLSREENPSDSPIRNENVVKKGNVDSHLHRHGGVGTTDSPKRVSRQIGDSDRSIETSPLHPHHQAKAGSKTGTISSPLWERKGSSEGTQGLGSSTPGRSRLRSVTHGDETPDNSPAVPKFGEWDENDPASAEGYTHIFNRVREEKNSGPAMITTESHTFYGEKPYGNDSKGCGCFPWGRK